MPETPLRLARSASVSCASTMGRPCSGLRPDSGEPRWLGPDPRGGSLSSETRSGTRMVASRTSPQDGPEGVTTTLAREAHPGQGSHPGRGPWLLRGSSITELLSRSAFFVDGQLPAEVGTPLAWSRFLRNAPSDCLPCSASAWGSPPHPWDTAVRGQLSGHPCTHRLLFPTPQRTSLLLSPAGGDPFLTCGFLIEIPGFPPARDGGVLEAGGPRLNGFNPVKYGAR